ncbi:hypothetical protein ASE23_23205 [Rhizobium sp. Root73]|uniref:hypothetical protein n=1 Tax=unclassified Rhizobium TaxID=2613769 RepID=UPI000724DB7E|nr:MULTISPECIES: hypothetical protein [unclassified Rhizobium]KQY16814.1 hypothetical protein ASD36_22610 [Rhizobium sp. Root1334]KRC11373.1 hypothetical protein ASE23_23205 [Rhizobium sp. Root73]
MMQGGSKTIGSRSLSRRETELEEYFADLPDGSIEQEADPQPQAFDDRQFQEELRRLSAYVSHLKRSISEFAESPRLSPEPARPQPNYATKIAGLVGVLIVGVAVGMTARLLAGRK